jgi:hypothetical protein
MDKRRIFLEGVHMIQHRRQNFIFDINQVHRLLGDFQSVGRHGRHGFTVVPNFVLGQNILVDDIESEAIV